MTASCFTTCHYREDVSLLCKFPSIAPDCYLTTAHIGFVSDRVLVLGDGAAGCGPCNKLGEISSGFKLASPLDKAQPISTTAITVFKGNMFGSSFILEGSRTERGATHVDIQFSGEQAGRHSRAAISLCPMSRWHAAGSP